MILLQILVATIFASPEDWTSLMEARSASELLLADNMNTDRSLSRLFCENEVNEAMFPGHCLELMAGGEVDQAEALDPLLFSKVSDLCVRLSEDLTSQQKVQQFLQIPLPKACRRALQSHLEDLDYVNSTTGTELVILRGHE